MHKTLIVTNDFPPRPGGIQAFLHNMALRLDPDRLVVYASTWKRGREGAEATAAFDAEQPFTVVRDRTTMLLPTPGATRRAVGLLREHGCTSVWFGAAAPLGLMAPALRQAGAERLVATTHGHEAGWAQLPAARQLLRRIGESHGHAHLPRRVHPVADRGRAHPGRGRRGWSSCRPVSTRRPSTPAPAATRSAPGSGLDRPAGRRVRLPAGPAQGPGHPDPGPAPHPGRRAGRRAADRRRRPVRARPAPAGRRARASRDSVRFTGAVPWAELPAHYGAGDVFAMPCRTRRGGLDVEGLGIVYLEASATGLPVVAGTPAAPRTPCSTARPAGSCGAARPRRPPTGIVTLLRDAELRRRMGERGRAWVEEKWRWDLLAERLHMLL